MAGPRAARPAAWSWRGAGAGMFAGALVGGLGGMRSWEVLLGGFHERRSPALRARFRGRGDRAL